VEPGELSVVADELSILKSLLPLPDKWHGLADVEKRYRQVLLTPLLHDVLGQLGLVELVKLPGTCCLRSSDVAGSVRETPLIGNATAMLTATQLFPLSDVVVVCGCCCWQAALSGPDRVG